MDSLGYANQRLGRHAAAISCYQTAVGLYRAFDDRAKHHCTFCGLNGTAMRFRAKSPQRVLDELACLARRYRSFSFEAVDNILDIGT